MKTKLIFAGMLACSTMANAQWTNCGSSTNITNTNTGQRVGIGSCPGTGTYTQYDQVDIGGTGRIRFSGSAPSNTWYGTDGGIIGMDSAGKNLVIAGGPGGLIMFGDPNGPTVNCFWMDPSGLTGLGTLTPADKLSVHGNVAPDTDNSYTSGTSAHRWSEVWAVNGTIQTSDKRFKTNIRDLSYGLKDILKLRPVSYNWIENNNGTRLGLIAQELKDVIGEVVYEGKDKNKNLGVAYAELIPVLIKGMQEQQQQIEDLKKQLAEQKQSVSTGINTLGNADPGFQMAQNEPNPFTHETVVRYTLPQSVSNAYMAVYDLTGKQITTFVVNEKGSSSITLTADKLSPGIYIYSIVADGKVVDSKRMVVADK